MRINTWKGAAIACCLNLAGCTAVSVQRIPPQDKVYPATTSADAPLVLAIPGLVVPGLRVTQDQHFGYLVQMLAAEGIPCRVIAYNTAQDPVSMQAALFSPDLAIAWTRVGPAIVQELGRENERRASLGVPPVKRLILIGYSQGGVITIQFAGRVFIAFREQYQDAMAHFGAEWTALLSDPEFTIFIDALDDYLVIENIKVQYERLFKESLALARLYAMAEKKLDRAYEEFVQYLTDPAKKYPRVTRFEGPASPYYPKRYEKIGAYTAAGASRSEEERERNKQFFVTYAQYHDLLAVEPYIVTMAGSLFGSPSANDTLNFARWIPGMKYILGREYQQIAQTELGMVQHLERIESLLTLKHERRYPVDPAHVLFIVGANGEKGDGLVDQPSAHLSRHSFTRMGLVEEGGVPRFDEVESEALPGATIVPLHVMHFPEKVMGGLGGSSYGAAYMVKGNPVFPYLVNFVRGDQEAIQRDLSRSTDLLRQFMIELTLPGGGADIVDARRKGQTNNIHVTGRYFNRNAGTIVWTGYFKESGIIPELQQRLQLLNPADMIPGVRDIIGRSGDEKPDLFTNLREHAGLFNPVTLIPGTDRVLDMVGLTDVAEASRRVQGKGEVRFQVRLPDGRKAPLTCTVYPGCISFVKAEIRGHSS